MTISAIGLAAFVVLYVIALALIAHLASRVMLLEEQLRRLVKVLAKGE